MPNVTDLFANMRSVEGARNPALKLRGRTHRNSYGDNGSERNSAGYRKGSLKSFEESEDDDSEKMD